MGRVDSEGAGVTHRRRICVSLLVGTAVEGCFYLVASVLGYVKHGPFSPEFNYRLGFWYTTQLPDCPACDAIWRHNPYLEITIFTCAAFGVLALLRLFRVLA